MNEELRVVIAAEITKFKQNVNNAKKTVKDFVKEGTKDFNALNEEFQKVGEKSKGILKGMAVSIAGATTALLALGQSGKEFAQSQAQLETAFKANGASAETAKKTYNELYRVLGDNGKATEAALHLGKLTNNQKDLAEWTNITKGVYATYGDSLPIESLTEAVNHTAKLGEVQGTLADALEWSGINVDEFNEQLFWCNSESEREKLIRDTLNGQYGEAAELYEKTNGAVMDQNDSQRQLNDALAKLYEVTAPIMAMLTDLLVQILEPLLPKLQEFIQTYGPQIEETLTTIGEAIGNVLSWIFDNWELVSTIAIVIAAISAALTVFSTVMGIVNAVMAASPVTWIVLAIVAAIAALIAIIVLCVKYWDEIKGAGTKAVEAIKKAWDTVANWFDQKVIQPIVKFFTNLWDKVTGIATNIKNGVVNAFTNMKDGISNKIDSIKDKATNTFTKVKDAITKPVEKARDAVKGVIDKIKGFFDFEFKMPKLKTPKFSITPSGWQIGDLLKGSIPKLGITWNARGGVFDKPTLFGYGNSLQGLGENGAEAVVPLENNLEWLNKLADMLSDRMGNGTPIYLTVDGKVFAQTVLKTVNANTKQTGKLGLVLS